jgi:copper chaperone NosL
MSWISRGLIALASLFIIGMYFQPLWNIRLYAPQYPDGLGMIIWVNKITGAKKHDLMNINLLNHYVGMKKIDPNSIPELKILPVIFGFMILLGFATAITGSRKLLYAWVVLIIVIGVASLVDFWWWEYKYGHELNPHAPIKIPGMAYQPPMFGCKHLLNFKACAYPATGTFLLAIAGTLGVISAAIEFFRGKNK